MCDTNSATTDTMSNPMYATLVQTYNIANHIVSIVKSTQCNDADPDVESFFNCIQSPIKTYATDNGFALIVTLCYGDNDKRMVDTQLCTPYGCWHLFKANHLHWTRVFDKLQYNCILERNKEASSGECNVWNIKSWKNTHMTFPTCIKRLKPSEWNSLEFSAMWDKFLEENSLFAWKLKTKSKIFDSCEFVISETSSECDEDDDPTFDILGHFDEALTQRDKDEILKSYRLYGVEA